MRKTLLKFFAFCRDLLVRRSLAVMVALFLCGGCAALLPASLQGASSLFSLGSLVIQLYTLDYGNRQIAVGWLPPQYALNEARLEAETWELNYQLVRKTGWESEDLTWTEILATVGRRAGNGHLTLALVHKRPLEPRATREIVTVYKTQTGKELRDPAEAHGEGWYPTVREQSLTIPMFAYTIFFFNKSRQPSGILAAEMPASSLCRTPKSAGALIVSIGKKTPAAHAALLPGEAITSVNGQATALQSLFSQLIPGPNTLTMCRDGRTFLRTLVMPREEKPSSPHQE